ncbi:HD domain-containing protein [Tabrizicola sp.]|uniref:HD domain-containing protein n=1 Tax=Tabrizicola sp. TaxID=2005166 RepID=UPI003F37DA46
MEKIGIDPAHDILHIQRVVGNAKRFAAEEPGTDAEVVTAAAWLHDVITDVPVDGPRGPSALDSARVARDFLRRERLLSADAIDSVHHAIAAHSGKGPQPQTAEARVLHDADLIDSLGAVGLARCIIVGGRFGASLYDEEQPIPESRALNDRRFIVDHFFERLFRLESRFLTPMGKREARSRTAFLRSYVAALTEEIVV